MGVILKRKNKYIKEERKAGVLGRQMLSSPTGVSAVFFLAFPRL
jgi:hypothetical protein